MALAICKGIIEQLDYLNDGDPTTTDDLGITGLWLMPIFESPSFITATMSPITTPSTPITGQWMTSSVCWMKRTERGIRIIIDFVLNHTSSQHPWFQAAQDPSSKYHDWYIWSDTGTSLSGWYASPGGFYFAMFRRGHARLLTTANPDVTAQMQDVSRFWLEEIGIDGFRLDAARHLLEEGPVQANTDSSHGWYRKASTHTTRA